jgi:hypothetical protein
LTGPGHAPAINDQAATVVDEAELGVGSMVQKLPDEPFSDTFDRRNTIWPLSETPIARQFIDGTYEITVTAPDRATSTIPRYLSALSISVTPPRPPCATASRKAGSG